MSFFSKAARFCVSVELFVSLSAVTAAFTALGARFVGLGFWDSLNLAPQKTFIALIVLNRLGGFILEAWERKRVALVSAGVLVAIAGFLINHAYRFEGLVSLGEAEEFETFEWKEAGPWGSAPAIGFGLESVTDEKKAVLSGPGFRATLSPGEYIRLGTGLKIGVEAIDLAPGFEIKDSSGQRLSYGFVKLRLNHDGGADYFMVTPLPHRFYLSQTGKEDKIFDLTVLRGKLVVARQEVARGEAVEFDGLEMSFPEISRWALIRVRKYPGNDALYTGLLMAAVGCAFMLAGPGKE